MDGEEGLLDRSGKVGGWAVAQDCRALMNNHPIEACHPAEELVPLPGRTAEVAICHAASKRDLDTGT